MVTAKINGVCALDALDADGFKWVETVGRSLKWTEAESSFFSRWKGGKAAATFVMRAPPLGDMIVGRDTRGESAGTVRVVAEGGFTGGANKWIHCLGIDTGDGLKGDAIYNLALLSVHPEAEDHLAGLNLHLLLWVDDECEQAVRQTGVLTKDDFMEGVIAILPVHQLVLWGQAPLTKLLHKN